MSGLRRADYSDQLVASIDPVLAENPANRVMPFLSVLFESFDRGNVEVMLTSHSPSRITDTLPFHESVRVRRSCRGFLPNAVPDNILMAVLEDAQYAPSNCNTQPWNVHIVRGAKLREISRVLHQKNDVGEISPDFSFDMDAFYGAYEERKDRQGKAYYEAMEVARNDAAGRHRAASLNYSFFGAPHVALLFMPAFGDCVRGAGDIGMYGQTFLLSLASRGISGIPQTALGLYAGAIREVLAIPNEFRMLFGISFGYSNDVAPGNRMRMGRVPVTESVTFHS